MIRKLVKKISAWCLAVAMIVSSCVCVFAIPTATTGTAWYKLDVLQTVEYKSDRMLFNIKSVGIDTTLSLTFPSIGGVRLVNENPGYFNPTSNQTITYTRNLDGTISLDAGTGITARVNTIAYPWSIEILNSEGIQVTEIRGDRLWYGLLGSTIQYVSFESPLENDEAIYGMGERYNSFNRVGYRTTMYNRDCWSDGDDSYNNVPIFNSSKGYMIFYNSATYATADVGHTDANLLTYEARTNKLDLFYWAGTPLENLSDYTELTGRAMQVPKWAFRFMPGAATAGWESTGNSFGLLKSSLNGYADYGLDDFDAIFGEEAFRVADVGTTVYDYLNGKGIRLLAWTAPFQTVTIENALKFLPNASTDPKDYELPMFKTVSGAYSAVDTVDFSHPAAVDLIKANWGEDVRLGTRGLMLDYGEYIDLNTDVSYAGMNNYENHNFNSYFYAKAYYEAFNDMAGEGQWLNYMRSGTQGAQAYTTNFCGDQYSTWDGLRRAVNSVLSMSASGFSTMGADIGGHSGGASKELYDRWLQFVTFNPLMRAHGKEGAENPWAQGTMSIFLDHYWLRENLVNQIYSSSIEANKTGKPMVQSMAVAYPKNKDLITNQDQFLFTEDLLVAPVLSSGATTRSVTLPAGTWVDLRTGTNYAGGNTYTMAAPRQYIPVLIRSGAVMPVTVSSNDLKLFTSMEDDKKTEAFLMTAPNGSNTSTVYTDSDNSTTFTSTANGSSFIVSANKSQSTRVIILQGVKATAVKVNGTTLSKLSANPTGTSTKGYYVDGNLRTVIRVTSNWSNIQVTTDGSVDMGEIEDDTSSGGATELPAGTDVSYLDLANASDTVKNAIASDFDVYYSEVASNGSLAKVNFADHFEFDGQGLRHIPTETFTSNSDMWAKKSTNVTTLIYNKGQYKNFEMTVRVGGSITKTDSDPLNTGDWLSTEMLFGVQDPTKWNNEGGGYIAGAVFNLNQESVSYINRMTSGGTTSLSADTNALPYYYGAKHESTFTVRVENGTATFIYDKTDYGSHAYHTNVYTLPSNYTGGQIGLKFMSDRTRVYFIDIKALDSEESGETVTAESVDYGDLTSASSATQTNIKNDFDVYYSNTAKSGYLMENEFGTHFEFTSDGMVHKPTESLTTTTMTSNITTMIYNKAEYLDFELKTRVVGSSTTARMGVVFGVQDPHIWWTEPYGFKTTLTYNTANRSFAYIRYFDEDAGARKMIQGAKELGFKGFNTEFDYIVKLTGNTLTVTVDYTAWGGEVYSQTLVVPDSYEKGKVGLMFVPDTTQIKRLSIGVPDDGKTVVCMGDDTTALGYNSEGTTASIEDSYTTYLAAALGSGYSVYNYGVTDATANGALISSCKVGGVNSLYNKSLERKPEVVVINYGASDALPENWGVGNGTGITAKEYFKGELLSLAASYKQALPDAQIYIATSTASYVTDAVYLANLAQVVEAQKEVAAELGLTLIDLNAITTARESWFPDGEIPGAMANTYIADEIAYAITGTAYLGDLNDDGKTDNADIDYMNKLLLKAEGYKTNEKVDFDADGKIDIVDFVNLRKLIALRTK